MLTLLAKLFNALNSESSPKQIAAAIGLGMMVGLTPLVSLHNLVLCLLAFLLRINLASFFVAITLFSPLGYLLSVPTANLGEYLLTLNSLQGLWTALYQFNLFKLAHFHNTLTLGSFVLSLMLFIPVMLLSQWLIIRYRHHLKAFIEKFKVVQALKSSRFYNIYQSLSGAN